MKSDLAVSVAKDSYCTRQWAVKNGTIVEDWIRPSLNHTVLNQLR